VIIEGRETIEDGRIEMPNVADNRRGAAGRRWASMK